MLSIGAYTLRTWGEDQAIRYLSDLEEACELLTSNPALGRACDDIRPGLRRMECGKRVIFYREDSTGIWISRILHQRMLPPRRVVEDEEESR